MTVADPVSLFSGEYVLSVTDFDLPARGCSLQLTRIYAGGRPYFGP